MARKAKTKTIIEKQMPDGGWVEHKDARKRDFTTIPAAELWLQARIQPGEILRIARVTGEYYIQHKVIKR